MVEKVKRIGEVLIESGLLTQEQLNELLNEQRQNPHMNIGEMASKRFDIPISTIETMFVEHIILPSVSSILLQALTQELSPFVAKSEFQINDLNIHMKIVQLELARTVTSVFKADPNKDSSMESHGRHASTMIHGIIDLSITITDQINVAPPDGNVRFTLDDKTGAITLEQSKLDGIKNSFRNAIRDQIGMPNDLDLVREEEMNDLLNRYYRP